MKGLLLSVLSIIEVLVYTIIAAYGFSGLYLACYQDPTESDKINSMIFGLLAALVFTVIIPVIFIIANWDLFGTGLLGAEALPYVLTVCFIWFIGLLIRIFK